MSHQSRNLVVYVFVAIATVLLGVASRRYPHLFPVFFAKYAGDTLWAALVYWLIAILRPRQRALGTAAVALVISFAVEISQLYHPAWLDAVRSTSLGALVLGHGFLWSDLACYSVGIAIAALLDRTLYTAAR